MLMELTWADVTRLRKVIGAARAHGPRPRTAGEGLRADSVTARLFLSLTRHQVSAFRGVSPGAGVLRGLAVSLFGFKGLGGWRGHSSRCLLL